jgi:hypothetical protein
MNHRFIGAVAGLTSLAIAVPAFAQVTGSSSSSIPNTMKDIVRMHRGQLSQGDVQTMIEKDNALLTHIDELSALIESSTQQHKTALTAAAAITDETQRTEAVRAAHQARHEAMKDYLDANPDLLDALPFPGKHMKMKGHGPHAHHERMAELLGMTTDELKAALEGGKTLAQIAEQKGIELPERIMPMKRTASPPTSQ